MAQETLSLFLSKRFKILCAATIFIITLLWNSLVVVDEQSKSFPVNLDTRSNNTSYNANKQGNQMGSIPTRSTQNNENILFTSLRNDTLSNVTTQRKLAPPTPEHWTQNKALDSKTDKNTSPRQGIILVWNSYFLTSRVGLDSVRTIHYDCGVYQCNVTKDRSYLNQSHVIILNPRVTTGMFIL